MKAKFCFNNQHFKTKFDLDALLGFKKLNEI